MKKVFFIALGVGMILLISSQPSFAQFYELSFTGNSFNPRLYSQQFDRHYDGYITSQQGQLSCQLNFPWWATGYNISRLSATFYDNSANYLRVAIVKVDRWTGNDTQVATVQSTGAVNAIRYMNVPKSSMSAYGIDNNRYAFFIYLYFAGSSDLRLHEVTVRWE